MAHPYKMAIASRDRDEKPSRATKPAGKKPALRNVKEFVTWSPSEKIDIARASLELMAGNPELSRVDAVRAAVEMMPASRRKPIKDMAHTQWILPLWEQVAAENDARNAEPGTVAASDVLVSTDALADHAEPVSGPENAPATPQKMTRQQAAILARQAIKAKMDAGEYRVTKWKDAEKHTIAKAFLRLKAANPKLNNTDAVREAVAALPAERQRKITGYSDVKNWLEKLIPTIEAELAAEAAANAARLEDERTAKEAKEAEERLQRETAEAMEAQERNEREMREQRERLEAEQAQQALEMQKFAAAPAVYTAPVEQRLEDVTESLTLEELLSLGARRLARAVLPPVFDEFRKELQSLKAEFVRELGIMTRPNVTQAPRHSPVMDMPPAAPKKPRVYVLGGRPEWHSDIKAAFGSKLDFTFNTGSNEGGNREMTAATNADLVLVCSDAVPHRDVDALQKVRAGFERVDGGSSSVKRRLSMYLSERGKAAAH